MKSKPYLRVFDNLAEGLVSPGKVLVTIGGGQPLRVKVLQKRFQRSDRDALRDDMISVGETMRGVIEREKATTAGPA